MSEADAKILGVVQVHVPVKSLKAAVPFYRDVVGLTFMFETNGMAFFMAGQLRVMVGEHRDGEFRAGGGVIYFSVADVRKASAALEQRGVKFVGPVETVNRTATHDLLLRIFKDPDGNMLALMGESPRA